MNIFINRLIIIINIIFFLYYSMNLLLFTDEFANKYLGVFNHAIAGLSEILGILFFCISIGLILIFFKGIINQLPFFITIFLFQFLVLLNLSRYIITDSYGETSAISITINLIIFVIVCISNLIFLIKNLKFL